jgi:signal transduction histidine kinase
MKLNLSVRTRLTTWFGTIFLLGSVLLCASVYVGLRSTIVKIVDGELNSRLDGVDIFLAEHILRLPTAKLQHDLSVHVALKPALLVVQDTAGEFLYCGTSVQALCGPSAVGRLPPLSYAGGLRIMSATRMIKGSPYRICVGSDLSFQKAILHQFMFWLWLLAPLVLLSSVLGGYWLSGRALEPVREIIRDVHAIGEHSLNMRLRVATTGDDIQRLSETLNGMLERVEDAFRQVRDLTANASHELRTPVSIIRTSAEIALLNARPTVETHRQALLQICAEAEKNTRLLDHMLMLARADSGAQALQFASVSLIKSVHQASSACRHLAKAKKIEVVHEEGEDMRLWADATHLNRLWLLLLDNAIKYTPPGGRVVVRAFTNAIGAPSCQIADTGIGIAEEDAPLIFNRFFRAENARLATDVGSGLGLEIAKWIATVHEATLSVESAVGVGSTFSVTFPAQRRMLSGEVSHRDYRSVVSTAV